MAVYTSYDQVGAKEDVSNVISNISPTATPFQSAIGKEKLHNKVFDWQEDSLRAVTDNNQAEAFDATFITVAPTAMRENVTQILAEAFQIAGTTDAITTYGRARESAYQMMKSMKQVKRDLENTLVGTAQAKVKPTDNSSNRKMAGYQAQIDTSTTVVTGATTNPLDEAHLLTCLQDIYNNGAEPKRIDVTPSNSLVVADFAKASGRYRTIQSNSSTADQKTIVNAVDLYVSPFGTQRVFLNRFQKAGNTLVYDPDMWALCTLRPWFRETLAKTGDSLKMMIVGEFSLKHKNFKASGGVAETVSGW
jgi:hypothetical protein